MLQNNIIIYISESPSQAFLIVLNWMLSTLQNIPERNWGDIFLAYDNMCHVDGMRVTKNTTTYSCQQWNLTKTQMEKMNVEYRQMLRKLVRGGHRKHELSMENDKGFKYKLKNSDIHRLCHTEDIEHFINKQQKKYLAQIIREHNNSTKKQLFFNDDKYCKKGRYTPSLLEQVVEIESTFTRDQLFKAAINRKF
jgi:hypothetical protein